MSYETATILFRHGEDDFAVWDVDLPERLLREARHAQNTATGDLGFIFDQLPVQESAAGDSRCQFLFEDGSAFALFTMEMDPAFFDEYRDKGCSVRGGKEEILAEITEQLQEQARQWTLAM